MIFGVDQHVRHVENGLLKIFRLVYGSSAQAPSCCARAAPADELGCCCGRFGRVAARVTFLHHSLLALEPSMALASFSLSLLIQVHEAAAVVADA